MLVSIKRPRDNVVVRPTPSEAKVSRRARRRTSTNRPPMSLRPSPSSNPLLKNYLNTLEDPWDYGPMKLGYDCFVPSVLMSGYLRGSFSPNADGSFCGFMMPTCTGTFRYSVVGANTTPVYATVQDVSNLTAITNNCSEARVVSYGLRLFATFASTSAPGVFTIGTDVNHNITTFAAITTNGITALASSDLCLGVNGARVVGYPIDNQSYTFNIQSITGYSNTSLGYSPLLYVTGNGFPSGTTIWYEVIVNLEGLPSNITASVGESSNMAATQSPSLVDYFPSVDSLYNSARTFLGSPVTRDALIGMASAGVSSRGGTFGRSQFGFGRALAGAMAGAARHLVAGRYARNRVQDTSLVIEELKDDF